MAIEKTRNLVWDALYMADVRKRYFAAVAGNLGRRERVLAFMVALSSSGTVASLLAKIPNAQTVSVILSLISASVAAFLVVAKHDKKINAGAALSRQWSEILSEYEILWAQVDTLKEATLLKKHAELERKHFPIDEIAVSEFKLNEKLLDKCFDEVARSRGLKVAA